MSQELSVSKVLLSSATTFFGFTGTVTVPWASVISTVAGALVLAVFELAAPALAGSLLVLEHAVNARLPARIAVNAVNLNGFIFIPLVRYA
ncbi:hypothetical protein D3C80_1825620 [compost metagenome]